MRWGRLGNRLHRAALLLAVLGAVVGGLAIAGLTWWLLWWLLGVKAETPNQLDLTKIALSVAAGVGAAVALVVAYRRQRDLERGRFAELFGAAARQLGDVDPAVRMAGVYAMAGVADEFSTPSRRQQCIDVLCGYLRMPYSPDDGANHLVSLTESTVQAGTTMERKYQYRQNDRDVRRTIVALIANHLRRGADVSWSACDFDFTGALLEDADFSHAIFAGQHTYFTRAKLVGSSSTRFDRAKFIGTHVTFRGALFCGGAAIFDDAEFSPGGGGRSELGGFGTAFVDAIFRCSISFERAVFRGVRTTFEGALMEGTRSSFMGVRFEGQLTSFVGARFVGPETSFTDVAFRAEFTSFECAIFDGDHIAFDRAEFSSARIMFTGSQFRATTVAFDDARIGVTPRLRVRGTRETDFTLAEFHGAITFARTVLGGRTVDFTEADFFGDISFLGTRFAAQEIHFDRPKAWVGTHFDWDDVPTRKPTGVKPNPWPPATSA
ncbi:pentapeptide repeat-containing protein [Nocardia sp. NPDC051990]|uniref:pentapeptide repeat-containing protein n=1 Tax=Nocardia sp. NPDC051990 TaxID=3155285 RepID=UPI003442BE6E